MIDTCHTNRWSTKPWIFGSYTYVSVDASGEDYDVLAEPHEDLIFFAGEHTNREHPATGKRSEYICTGARINVVTSGWCL